MVEAGMHLITNVTLHRKIVRVLLNVSFFYGVYMTKYFPEVVVGDQCSVFFGAKRYTRTPGRTRVTCHTTLSFNPLNQFPQSQCEYYALFNKEFNFTASLLG